jgi:hypothetical protein
VNRDAAAAGAIAAVVGGVPSTVWAILAGRDPLEATLAAGSMLLSGERGRLRLLAAAVPVHLTVSLGWACVLERTLPRRHELAAGMVAGAAIAAVDLGIVARWFPRIRAVPLAPQVADHVAYGATVGYVLAQRRR